MLYVSLVILDKQYGKLFMSMPSTNYVCEKCNFTGSSCVIWGNYNYLINGIKIDANRDLGWCNSCATFKPIECFEPDSFLDKIEEYRKWLKELQSSLFMQIISKTRRVDIQCHQDKIYAYAFMLHKMQLRKGTEKCFTCGSEDVIPSIYDDYQSTDNNGRTGFIHPDCGGEFIITGGSMWHMKHRQRFYDVDGIFIRDEDPINYKDLF